MEVEHPEAFLTKSPYELVEKREIIKVPLLIGINSEESIGKAQGTNIDSTSFNYYNYNYLLCRVRPTKVKKE